MRAIVVGAGAWGLPAAAQLALRGHQVVLVDRYGVANDLSSSPGPTRAWRLADPDPVLVRLSKLGVEAMDRLAERSGVEVYRRVGLLWRDPAQIAAIAAALAGEQVPYTFVPAADVGQVIPGLRSDERDALWTQDAGCVLAAASMTAQALLLKQAGGVLVTGLSVVGIDAAKPEVTLDDGTRLDGDVVVLAPGTGAVELLPMIGVELELQPWAEQVVHFGRPSEPTKHDRTPCLFDGPVPSNHQHSDGPLADGPSFYAMPTPGVGYKIGLDVPLRAVAADDLDRSPNAVRTAETAVRAARLGFVEPTVLDAQVCTYTDSPDGRFVVDCLDRVVLACGDSGAGFKHSALMGELLADLAEGATPYGDLATFSLSRFQ